MPTVEAAIARVPGEVGVAAKHLDSLEELHYNSDRVFFPASTFKVPILAELYRQVDKGVIDPKQRLELTDKFRAPGSGVLKQIGSGLRPTVHDLAMLMIIISDNTATDMLYDLVGRERLNKTMRDLGLTKTNLPMSCRELLYSVCGVETDDIPLGNSQVTARLVREEIVPGAAALSQDRGDVSSPHDMMRLLEIIYNGQMHSPESRDAMMDILGRQQLKNVIPAELPLGTKVAHKTGGFPSVRCDVGIVFSPAGPYIVAIMAKNVTEMKSIDGLLATVSRAVYDRFNP